MHVSESCGHDIQVYSDIDARWTGRESRSQRNFEEQDGLAMFSLTVQDAPLNSEADDIALWGSTILASRPTNFTQLSALSGSPEDVRGLFVDRGVLSREDDKWRDKSVVALAHDLGQLSGGASVNFVTGYEREAAIHYLGGAYTGFYRAEYPILGRLRQCIARVSKAGPGACLLVYSRWVSKIRRYSSSFDPPGVRRH